MKLNKIVAYAIMGAGLAFSATLQAQNTYPNTPVRMVVGFPPGGISDVLARAVANEAAKELGQSIIVENRPGAGTTIAAGQVARAKPDGYTLLFQDLTTHAINASLYKKLAYDTIEDFTPIATVSTSPLLLVASSKSPTQSVKQLIDEISAKPGDYSYGTSGNGTIIHLASEAMNQANKLDVVHIPYGGSAALITATMTGDLKYAFSSMPPAVAQIQAGSLRGLAVTTPERVSILPDVPTIREAGVPEAEFVLYSGVLAPAGVPTDVADTLNKAFQKASQSQAVRDVYRNLGASPAYMTQEQITQLLQSEIQRYATIVETAGVQTN